MKSAYYCLVASLAEISYDDKRIPYALYELKAEVQEFLSSVDKEALKSLFWTYDNQHLLAFIEQKAVPEISLGNLLDDIIEEAVKHGDADGVPSYMISFLEEYKERKLNPQEVSLEHQLMNYFYDYLLSQTKNGFLKEWFTFDMRLRNLMTALNCRKYELDFDAQIVGDDEFSLMLKTHHRTKDFGLAAEYEFVEHIVSDFDALALRHREEALDKYRWEWLEEHTTFEYFSVEFVFAYILKMIILERWTQLDETAGKKKFEALVESVKGKIEFSNQFMK